MFWAVLVVALVSLQAFVLPHVLCSGFTIVAKGTHRRADRSSSQLESTRGTMMRRLDGIREIVNDYDVFLLDMWGVMHDGTSPYAGVLETVQQLKQSGKTCVVLSNSSKRRDNAVKMLKKLGFDPADFEQIITSGEVAFDMLRGADSVPQWEPLLSKRREQKCFVLGSGDFDEEYCNSAGWTLAPIQDAELIVARGVFTIHDGTKEVNKRSDPELYEARLQDCLIEAAKKRLPMLVCNPDKIRPDAERPPMPGKLGDSYEAVLGGGKDASDLVKRIGKPIADVYDLALSGVPDRSRVCMVGDALETDVAGGNIAGVASLWVLKDGVYKPELKESGDLEADSLAILKAFNKMDGTYAAGRKLSPEYIIPHFQW